MNMDPDRLHLITEQLENLAAECRAMEAEAACGHELMRTASRQFECPQFSAEDLAEIGRRMNSGQLLTGPNLLLWRNVSRVHKCVRVHEA